MTNVDKNVAITCPSKTSLTPSETETCIARTDPLLEEVE